MHGDKGTVGNALTKIRSLAPGKSNAIKKEIFGLLQGLVGARRIEVVGGGVMTEPDAKRIEQANNYEGLGKDVLDIVADMRFDKLDADLKAVKNKRINFYKDNLHKGRDEKLQKFYNDVIDHEGKNLSAQSIQRIKIMFKNMGI